MSTDMGAGARAFDAVVLAGGQARRLDGLDKPAQEVGGRSLLGRVVSALAEAGARRVVVVGPRRDLPGAVFVREDPPGGGPVPALRAGLAEVEAPCLALFAGDLPFLVPWIVAELLKAAESASGAVLVDNGGREQWLAGTWRVEALREALAGYEGGSLRGLLGPLGPVRLAVPPRPDGADVWFDCDTMDDLRTARRLIARREGEDA
ncbi:molybdenum cofactor guanylyltransferase [Sinosporangium siamense]|nr:NTP transferase domain-containing protein [Sinosporangium siamense]